MAWNSILAISPQIYEAQLQAEADKKRKEEEQRRTCELLTDYMAPVRNAIESYGRLYDSLAENVSVHAEISQQLAQMIKDKAPKEDINEIKNILNSLENRYNDIMYGE